LAGDVAVKTSDPLIIRTMGVGNDPFHQLTGKPSCQHCITNLTVVELISVLVTIDGTAFKWALAGDVAVKTSDPLIIRTLGVGNDHFHQLTGKPSCQHCVTNLTSQQQA
jgi:hypothetical protein